MSRVWDAAVQDRCPDTVQANDGPAADDLVAIQLEVVVAVAARVCDVEKKAIGEEVAAAKLVQDMMEMAMEDSEIRAPLEEQCQKHTMEEAQALRERQHHWQMKTAVQAIIRTFC